MFKLFFALALVAAPAQPPQTAQLRVAIRLSSSQSPPENNVEFNVLTAIVNASGRDTTLLLSQCAFSSSRWIADNPVVRVKQIMCKKNTLFEVLLPPGKSFDGPLPVRIVGANSPAVTFRLAFKLREGPDALKSEEIVWSNPLTVSMKHRALAR